MPERVRNGTLIILQIAGSSHGIDLKNRGRVGTGAPFTQTHTRAHMLKMHTLMNNVHRPITVHSDAEILTHADIFFFQTTTQPFHSAYTLLQDGLGMQLKRSFGLT